VYPELDWGHSEKKTKFWKYYSIMMQLVTPKTSPLLTVRVHVPLTVSVGKYSE